MFIYLSRVKADYNFVLKNNKTEGVKASKGQDSLHLRIQEVAKAAQVVWKNP